MSRRRSFRRHAGPRFREGRYKARRIDPSRRRSESERPILNILSLLAVLGVVVLCSLTFSISMLASLRAPLHLTFPTAMTVAAVLALLFGRHERMTWIFAVGLMLATLVGTAALYSARDEFILRPVRSHDHDVNVR